MNLILLWMTKLLKKTIRHLQEVNQKWRAVQEAKNCRHQSEYLLVLASTLCNGRTIVRFVESDDEDGTLKRRRSSRLASVYSPCLYMVILSIV